MEYRKKIPYPRRRPHGAFRTCESAKQNPDGGVAQWNTCWRDASHSNSADNIGRKARKERNKAKLDLGAERPEQARARFRLH